MDKKLFGTILVVVVGVIMAGSLLAPIVSDYADEEKIYYNEGMPFAAADDDTHTITVTTSAITVDGEEIDQSLFPSGFTSFTIVYGEDSFIRYTTTDLVVQYVSSTATKFEFEDATITIAISGTNATVTTTADNTTATMSDILYYVSTEGTHVLSLNPCVTSETTILGAGYTNFTTPSVSVATVWSGTSESVTATVIRTSTGTATVTSTAVNTTAVNESIIRIDSVLIDYDATVSETDYDLTSTYTYFLAPYEVSYENPTYLGSATSGLLVAVVVIFLVALIIIPTRFINRDD